MENAASAIKMAAAILIFIIALATSFSIFGTAKRTADSIITMRDKQKYLEAAELDNGILYTSSEAVEGETGLTEEEIANKFGVTTTGDRVVKADDVISTIYRYSKEKYGVTIVKSDGTVLARFDGGTEDLMRKYKDIESESLEAYETKLKINISTTYITADKLKFTDDKKLEKLYQIKENTRTSIGAPWYGDEVEIQKRINADLSGAEYKNNGQTYQGKGLLAKLTASNKIIEVTNEIDNSKYLKQTDENGNLIDENGNVLQDDDITNAINSNLLQQYQMPTIEIIYIIYEK